MKRTSSLYSHPILLKTTDNFNWSLSDAINPFEISVSDQSFEFHRFLNNFTKAKTFSPATPDQYWHLIQNLQCTIQSYDKYVLSLQSDIQRLQKSIKKSRKYYQKKLNDIKKDSTDKYLCPICLEPQVTLVDLDYHIAKKHNNVYDKWNCLRCEELNNFTSGNTSKQEEIQISDSNSDNTINGLHNWMNNKFDYLESLITKKKDKKHHHHHHRMDDNVNQSPKVTISSKLNYQNANLNQNQNEMSPFHKSDKHIFNLPESSDDDDKIPFSTPNKKIIQSNEDLNQFDDFNLESSEHSIHNNNNEENEEYNGHFVEEIENNNNHNIFFSTTSLNKLRSKSEDTYN